MTVLASNPYFLFIVATGGNRGRRAGRHTVAGVEANDEAGLLLNVLRHCDGRDVVDCRWVGVASEDIAFGGSRLCALRTLA